MDYHLFPAHGSESDKRIFDSTGNGGGRPPFSFPSEIPAPDRVPHASPERPENDLPETYDRPPRASGGDRWMAMREQ